MYLRRGILLLLLTSIFTLLAACDEEDGDGEAPELRFVQASPDAPSVDLLLYEEAILERVGYLESTDYFEIDEEAEEFKLTASDSFTTFFTFGNSLREDEHYTLISLGYTDEMDGLLLLDDNAKPESSRVKLRFVNAAPSAPDIDVYVVPNDSDLSMVLPTVSDLGFSEDSDYVTGLEGDYQIQVTPKDSSEVIATSDIITFESGQIRSILLVEDEGGGAPFNIIFLRDRK